MIQGLVLSTFTGAGLLDGAFAEQGCCVVCEETVRERAYA